MPSWNRMFRKSVSSSSSGGDQSTLSNPTTAASSSPPSDAGLKSPPPTPVSKSSSWRFGWGGGGNSNNTSIRGGEEAEVPELAQMKKKKKKKSRGVPVHPSERELTEQNLRHQELLSAFTMSFGRSRKQSAGGRTNGSGVSPGCSRSASLDSGYAQGHHHGQGQRLSVVGAPQMEDVRE